MARGVTLTAAAAAVVLAALHAGPGITAIGPVRRRAFPGLSGLGRADHVALTFDDGPDPHSTPALLDLLANRGVRATFFMLGSMVARAPRLAAEVTAAGHEAAIHGWHHRYTVLSRPSSTRVDLVRAHDVVAVATGEAPRWYRPPHGVLSTAALTAARDLSLTPVLWSCWGREWAPGATAESVHATLSRGLGPGATVLLHDSDVTSPPGSAAAALAALPRLLDTCELRGLRAGPLAEHGLGETAPRG